ncbi:MAG: TIGR03619 family F420-dependent LLM class oxidoreductase [Acidimicrobiia bacterium]|nr:TIGR03619 family F420-dependent LLM class oxidoreductase [Acidimicrobiia bacterium]
MRFGATFPTTEIGDDPVAIRDFAQAAEGLGYSHIVAYDHVLGAEHAGREPKLWGPYTEAHPFHEPFVLLGFLAGVTSTIEFETAIIILPQRQTVLVAKQAAEVDVLSGGRLRLGVGTGWNPVEYEALGVPWEGRGARFDDQIALLRQLWAEPVLDVTTPLHKIDRAGILPRPRRPIPLWLGGSSNVALRRAARVGDGFTFASAGRKTVELVERLRGLLETEGRDPATFPIEFTLMYGLGEARWAAVLEGARAAGIDYVSINAMSTTAAWTGMDAPGLHTVAEHIGALERFMQVAASA